MGKKIPSSDIRAFPILRTKSFGSNLNAFIRMLETEHSHLSSREFVIEVHAFVARARMKNRAKDFTAGLTRQKIRICRACDDWSGSEPLLQCSLCEDFYHLACRGESREALSMTGLCMSCELNRIRELDRQAYLHELIEDRCFSCG